jgi:hypothetical protein
MAVQLEITLSIPVQVERRRAAISWLIACRSGDA